MKFPRQEYWSRLPFPLPLDLPNPETEPECLMSPLGRRIIDHCATWGALLFYYEYTPFVYCNYRFLWTCLYHVVLNSYLSHLFCFFFFPFMGKMVMIGKHFLCLPIWTLKFGEAKWVILNNRNASDISSSTQSWKGQSFPHVLLSCCNNICHMAKPSSTKPFSNYRAGSPSDLDSCAVRERKSISFVLRQWDSQADLAS